MSPRVKQTRSQKIKTLPKRLVKTKAVIAEEEKENSSTNPNLRKVSKELPKGQSKELKLKKTDNSLSSAQKTEVKINQIGFWSKKLQDLEKSPKKNKSELYDFSCTDESDASYKIKKKQKQKRRIQKKRQPTEPKFKKPGKKTSEVVKTEKKVCKQPLSKKEAVITTESKKLMNESNNQSIARTELITFTSTPAVNKNNVVDPSSLLFLSPIIKEESENINGVHEYAPDAQKDYDGSPIGTHFNQETRRLEVRQRRISCRRVLRSGKMF